MTGAWLPHILTECPTKSPEGYNHNSSPDPQNTWRTNGQTPVTPSAGQQRWRSGPQFHDTEKNHPHSEIWWWQHHTVGMFFISRDWKLVRIPSHGADCWTALFLMDTGVTYRPQNKFPHIHLRIIRTTVHLTHTCHCLSSVSCLYLSCPFVFHCRRF